MVYPNVVSKVRLVNDEGNQVASGHVSTPNEEPAVVQHDHLHAQSCQLETHKHTERQILLNKVV